MVKLFHCCNRFSNGKDERTKGLQQSLCGYNIKRQGYKDDEWSDGIKYFKKTFKRFASSSMLLSHCLVYNHPPTEVCTTSGESVAKIIILLDIRQYCAIYLYIKGPLLLLHWYCQWRGIARWRGIVGLDLRWTYDVRLFSAKKLASDWLT